ncbi:MAG: hypothetical protein OEZ68_08680 [Gammaproteobacteria bacterium]|nr:hypothetical protein [Gammaproteobacteria bacterium]MDH5800861.1 hypothetical protein [Gammaproteobacteria bacterium]
MQSVNVQKIVALFRKDPFGVPWFFLSFSLFLLVKWQLLQPMDHTDNCLNCVLAILLFLSVLVSVLLSLFWVLWEARRRPKGVAFLFLFTIAILFATFLFDILSQQVFSQLYYGGILPWQEAEISFLMDDFLKHSAGLFLAVLMLYSMARIAFCSSFVNRKYVLTMNMAFFLTAALLLVMGMLFY